MHIDFEVTDPKRLHEYLVEALGPEKAERPNPLSVYLREEVFRVASQVPGVAVRDFRGSGRTGGGDAAPE